MNWEQLAEYATPLNPDMPPITYPYATFDGLCNLLLASFVIYIVFFLMAGAGEIQKRRAGR